MEIGSRLNDFDYAQGIGGDASTNDKPWILNEHLNTH
jgi:hypothetical protein